ncbi:MAG: lyase family protein [Planctomycetota bacterium]
MEAYVDPLAERYASRAMVELFSPHHRALVWRDLWIALARTQSEMGLSAVTQRHVDELVGAREQVDLTRVAELEKRLRHDVMAHIHAYGEVAPGARGVIHLGATSCYVTDNADLILMRRALRMLSDRLLRVIHGLGRFAAQHAELPTLGLTHLQPAQLTTVGKRAALWIQDLVTLYEELEERWAHMPFRGAKGTTGTQASFLHLFGGDARRVRELDERLARHMGFDHAFAITGQTYPRIWDYRVLSTLCGLGVVLHKFSTDLRLLQSWGEVEEPYHREQVGSSAMPYKRNPMKAERISSLSKLLMTYAPGMANVAATQWMERTLDDSAFRRVAITQAFFCADALLLIARNVAEGLHVNPHVARRRVDEHLPYLAAEELLMQGVGDGGDRQGLHERIRQLAWEAREQCAAGAPVNPLRSLLEADPVLAPIVASLPPWDARRFVGLAPEQTRNFLDEVVSRLPVPPEDNLRELSV